MSAQSFLEQISKLAGGFDITDEMLELATNFIKKNSPKTTPKKKDPNAPKKPTNAYMIFAKEERQKIQKDSEITESKDLIKEIARRWNEEKEKESKVFKKYTKQLEEDKKKYEKEMETYVPSDDYESPKKKKSPKKDPNAPKKPTNAYMIFASEERQKIQKDSGITDSKDLMKEIARRWNQEKEKESKIFKKYTKQLEEAKKKYEKEIAEYNSEDVEEDVEEDAEEDKSVKKKTPKKK